MTRTTAQKNLLRDKLASELGARESVDGAAALTERMLNQLRGMDFRSFEAMPPDVAVVHMACGPVPELVRVMNEAARLVRSLPPLVGAAEPAVLPMDDNRAELESGNPVVPVEGVAAPVRDRFSEDLDASMKSMAGASRANQAELAEFVELCQRTIKVLRESTESLRQARREQSKWGLITAAEEGRRKAQKSLRATTIIAMRMSAPAQAHGMFPNDVSELQSALAVRAVLLGFRRDMLALLSPLGSLPDVEVGLLMRDVRIRLSQLFSERAYSDVRAPDRFNLQAFHNKISGWLDHVWEDFGHARQLLLDVGAFAEQLALVNRRDILVQHDREVKEHVLARLQNLTQKTPSTTQEDWRGLSGALNEVLAMEWRDDALDLLVKAELTQGAAGAADVQSRAGLLVAALAAVHLEDQASAAL